MLQHQRIFELSQLASLADGHKEDRILDWSLARESDIVVFLTERSSDVFAVSLNDSHVQPTGGDVGNEEGELSIRSLKWYEDPDLRPVCLSFSPDEECAVGATVSGSLFIVPVQLLVPNHQSPWIDKGKDPGQNVEGGRELLLIILYQVTNATKEHGERRQSLGCSLKNDLGLSVSKVAECHLRCCGTRLATRASPLPSWGPN